MSNQDELETHAATEETGYADTQAPTPDAPPQVLPDPAIQPRRPGEPPQIEPEPPDPQEPWSDPEPLRPPREPQEPRIPERGDT
jgi:hypothetical protein